ncbi:hypothetical protein D0Z07_9224 [Hyphodiscus hymeniophilus]|uniref:Uncharacterized protein n=1 Tax=Hyphodiscus hymeniophilus TaxID=353542 RepID=A0A9P6SJT9_9HELO|nr:hypothetical protein D0Z07_9224 [Hyphodiscus hymeniophilus]
MHISIPEPGDPGFWVSRGFRLTIERIPFDVDELIRTPLSNRPWQLYRVPADHIEPFDSDWKQISLAPGIHVAGKSYDTYRVAIDDSYLPWLSVSKFKFQPDINPLKPVDGEVSVYGERAATRNAIVRFHRDALKAISSRKGPELDCCYRNVAEVLHQVALEWAILKRDLNGTNCCQALNPKVKTKFTQLLLFITLNLVNVYNTPLVLNLLRKDEEELLHPLWDIYSDPSAYITNQIPNFSLKDELLDHLNAAEFHRLSLVRSLAEIAGAKIEVRQYKLDLDYTYSYNHNILGCILGISGSNPFGTFASQKMLDALSKSPVFSGDTIRKLDVVKLSAELMGSLPIGFPDGHLDLPFDVRSKLTYGQVQIIRTEMLNFYYDHRSLETPENDVLVLLTWNPIRHIIDEDLVEWTASVDGWRLYERLIKSIQVSQPKEQLVLTLAALLCYQRLFPPSTLDTNHPIKWSYQADFDAILNGERLSNARTVFEYMAISVLRVFCTVNGNQKMRTFLASIGGWISP